MSDTVSEVISIEDDDDEDVEVVFTTLNKSVVYRNLICQKISQQIELLEAMCKHTFPNGFSQFKEQAKKMGFQYGDDVIQSAWQMVMKKHLMNLTSFPKKKAAVCLVKPLQTSVDISTPRANTLLSSPHSSSLTGPSSSTPIASTAIPVALVLNKSVLIENLSHQRTECSVQDPKLIETDTVDVNVQTTDANDTASIQVVLAPESRYREIDAESVVTNKVSSNKRSSRKRKSETVNGQTTDANDTASKQVVLAPESRYREIDPESVGTNKVSTNKRSSRKRKSETDVFSFDLDKQGFPKSGSEESGEIQTSYVTALPERFFHGVVSSQNRLSEKTKVTWKSSQECKSSKKQVVPLNSPKTINQADKQIVSLPESRCSITNYKYAYKNNISSEKKFSKKRKSTTDILSFDFDNSCLTKSVSGKSDGIQNSFLSNFSESYFQSVISEQNQLGDVKKVTKKSSQKSKSSGKQGVPLDKSETVDQAIAKSHVGVKANIVRTKQASSTKAKIDTRANSSKRLSKISKLIKEMSVVELKEFKAEQKRLKYAQKCEFEMQQLQKVHDRLVDVLIPKYYNKDLSEKG